MPRLPPGSTDDQGSDIQRNAPPQLRAEIWLHCSRCELQRHHRVRSGAERCEQCGRYYPAATASLTTEQTSTETDPNEAQPGTGNGEQAAWANGARSEPEPQLQAQHGQPQSVSGGAREHLHHHQSFTSTDLPIADALASSSLLVEPSRSWHVHQRQVERDLAERSPSEQLLTGMGGQFEYVWVPGNDDAEVFERGLYEDS